MEEYNIINTDCLHTIKVVKFIDFGTELPEIYIKLFIYLFIDKNMNLSDRIEKKLLFFKFLTDEIKDSHSYLLRPEDHIIDNITYPKSVIINNYQDIIILFEKIVDSLYNGENPVEKYKEYGYNLEFSDNVEYITNNL